MKQLEFDFNKGTLENKLRDNYEQFNQIEDVWAAGRFAKKHEPKPDWREKGLFYVPARGRSWELKNRLFHMYPESKADIRKMNKKQAYKFYMDIMHYKTKVERILKIN